VILYSTIITPEIVAHVWVEMLINAVLTLSKKVKIKIKTSVEKSMRFTLLLSGAPSHHPKITGMTGRTQGASTESMPETNEIIMISID
jgi:hypothetical protein